MSRISRIPQIPPDEGVSKALMCYDHPVMGGNETPASWWGAMIIQVLHCPNCQGTDILKFHDPGIQ
jgi:hypothetical protein